MTLFCSLEKYIAGKGWQAVQHFHNVDHGDTIRLKVDGKMNTIATDVLKVSEKSEHARGRQIKISVLGFTWRYCCDAKEIVMIYSEVNTLFILNI